MLHPEALSFALLCLISQQGNTFKCKLRGEHLHKMRKLDFSPLLLSFCLSERIRYAGLFLGRVLQLEAFLGSSLSSGLCLQD